MRTIAPRGAWATLWIVFAACSSGSSSKVTPDASNARGGSGGGSTARDASATGGSPGTGGMAGGGGSAPSGGVTGAGGANAGGASANGGGIAGSGGGPFDGGGATDSAGSDGRALDTSADARSPDGTVDAPLDAPLDAAMDVAVDAPRIDVGGIDMPATRTNTCVGPASAALANASLPPGYCAWTWATGLSAPRGITRNPNGDILVVEQSAGRITLLYDDDRNGVSGTGERVALVTLAGLNHGIAIDGGYLYASTTTTVYRWAYTGGRQPLGTAETVVTGLPSGGHSTRTLLFDGSGNLYVSVGSASNLDTNTDRARIVRYPASALGHASTFAQGEAFATGLRNEVGLTLDARGRVWGVQNGSDDLSRADLGGDIHTDNPAEELNLFAQADRFHGYPYCWTEYTLPSGIGLGRGTQWAYPGTMTDGTHTDAWCRNTTNVVPPVLAMQAHSAPLDIKFYAGSSFPAGMTGTAIISFHGSWDRTPATGYKVVSIPFGQDGMPSGDPTPLLEYSGTGDSGSGWPHRPVGIETGTDGRLFVTSDASNIVIAIGYGSN